MTTLIIEQNLNLPKTSYKTLEEAYHAWLEVNSKFGFIPLKIDEINDQRRADWDEVENMSDEDFVRA